MITSLETALDKQIYWAAARYSKINNFQLHYGKKLAAKVGIKQGDKILDMGCGTGELTSFIGEIVGKQDRVVGVDPDIDGIHYANQHNCNVNENVSFEIGDSSSKFVQPNKSFYDAHFSNFSFQWLTLDEKKEFSQTAFECLKPNGQIALKSHEGYPEIALFAEYLISKKQNALTYINDKKLIQFFISKDETTSLIEEMGFVIISSDYDIGKQRYETLDDFLNFLALLIIMPQACPTVRKEFMARFGNEDGSVNLVDDTLYQIVTRKNCRSG
ncbi:uncharacterized methyltransferase C70.08c-like [Xenia sp. Carnegie-2017]|uniref:uncharacterized methyltransferase C70.08c-like n=1 Tax=Xenia sp. Carnegie-2017 TaxID=2897299 RepID=UPI001F03823D|nr:uncharacterized methyltransferase C70.08c-like [Xenia sp. Carnegie-2017]